MGGGGAGEGGGRAKAAIRFEKLMKMSFFFAETMTYLLTHSSLQLVRKLIIESAVRESFLKHCGDNCAASRERRATATRLS